MVFLISPPNLQYIKLPTLCKINFSLPKLYMNHVVVVVFIVIDIVIVIFIVIVGIVVVVLLLKEFAFVICLERNAARQDIISTGY